MAAKPRIFTSTKTKLDQRDTEVECLRLLGFFRNAQPRDVVQLMECGLVEPASAEAAERIRTEMIDESAEESSSSGEMAAAKEPLSVDGSADGATPPGLLMRLTRELHVSYLINRGLVGLGPQYVWCTGG